MTRDSVGVVGGGIVGLAIAHRLVQTRPGVHVVVLEKETRLGAHQTGHNSGVVHAGLYYAPETLKAELCRRGRIQMREFCLDAGIPYRELGKVVVATDDSELPALRTIFDRAVLNQVPGVRLISSAELGTIEPHVGGIAAVHSPETAVTDFRAVALALATGIEAAGGEIRLGVEVRRLQQVPDGVRVETSQDSVTFATVIACAGLGTDLLRGRRSLDDQVRTVPFRGAYYELRPPLRDQVKGLVYPVPDPRYPFLGVHLTRTIDDEVLVGPTAVLAAAREGYRWRDVSGRDVFELARFPGAWRLARQHWRTGLRELHLAMSRRAFARGAQRYLPVLTAADLQAHPAGVRAQALHRDGSLIDDFLVDTNGRLTIVRNAPSPAATSSFAIAEHVVDTLH